MLDLVRVFVIVNLLRKFIIADGASAEVLVLRDPLEIGVILPLLHFVDHADDSLQATAQQSVAGPDRHVAAFVAVCQRSHGNLPSNSVETNTKRMTIDTILDG